MDKSSIVLFISGQVNVGTSLYKYPHIRQFGVQEVNIIDIVKPITKFAQGVTDSDQIKYILEKIEWYIPYFIQIII